MSSELLTADKHALSKLIINALISCADRGSIFVISGHIAHCARADSGQCEITIRGVQLYDRGAPANSATAPLALEDARASELLSALVDAAGSRRRQHARPTTDRDFGTTGIGLIHMRLTVDAVPLDRRVTNGRPDIADLLLALVQEAGLPFHDRLHPFPADMR